MKREIISFAIGAGIVGSIWGTAEFCQNKPSASETAEQTDFAMPNSLKKILPDVYSAKADRNFTGLKLYSTDFLIPWNRTAITEYAVFDDPKEHYGSGNAPMSAFMFRIEEKGKHHYFFTSGMQWDKMSELIYLGENIDIKKVEAVGNGYIMTTYKDSKGKTGKAIISASYMTGSKPEEDPGIAQHIQLDSLLKYAEKCDPFVWRMTAEQLWKLFQKSIRENDAMTIAKMITFPIPFRGEQIYTRAEFVKRFDEIIFPEYRDFVLKTDASAIWYSWRGACLPDSCSWCSDASEGRSAGPLSLFTDRWMKYNLNKEAE